MMSIACTLLMIWHVILNRKMKTKLFFGAVVLIVLMAMFAYADQMYRGGSGLSGLSEVFSFRNLTAYARGAAWSDFEQLHRLAGATAIGPGVLEGRSFIGMLIIGKWLGFR